jgi:hypothetical protein
MGVAEMTRPMSWAELNPLVKSTVEKRMSFFMMCFRQNDNFGEYSYLSRGRCKSSPMSSFDVIAQLTDALTS